MSDSGTLPAATLDPTTVDVARQLYDAFNRGDIPAVLALFDPGIEFREAEGNPYRPDGTPWVGPQAILDELFMRIGAEWGPFGIAVGVIRPMVGGYVMEGRYQSEFKATGRRLDAQVCHVIRVRDGRITHFQQYIDTAALQWAMGASLPR